jgi:hypothetical protein
MNVTRAVLPIMRRQRVDRVRVAVLASAARGM